VVVREDRHLRHLAPCGDTGSCSYEREKFPRHQIGESLLPATVHGICRLLGIENELKRQNFPVKRGGTFLWGKKCTPWTFAFSKTPNSPTGTAYQVERMKFDSILMNNARSNTPTRADANKLPLPGMSSTPVEIEVISINTAESGCSQSFFRM
jgi:hypothetical protein